MFEFAFSQGECFRLPRFDVVGVSVIILTSLDSILEIFQILEKFLKPL